MRIVARSLAALFVSAAVIVISDASSSSARSEGSVEPTAGSLPQLVDAASLAGTPARTVGESVPPATSGAIVPPACNNLLGPYPRLMNPNKPKAPSLSGRTDLALDFTPGLIRVRIACGRSIVEIMQRHALKGPAAYWSPAPFDLHDLRAGLDRSFRIGVEPGTEKQWVQKLAPLTSDFDWVLLDWHYEFHLATYVPTEAAIEVYGLEERPLAMTTNDPKWSTQLSLQRANFPTAWDRTVSFSAVIVGVVDSGLRGTHEDLGTWKRNTGYDYEQGIEVPPGTEIDTGCDGGHGTHVASIAAGDTNNTLGNAGAGFNSGLLSMRVITGNNCGGWAASTRDWPIRWARLHGALIVNMSYYWGQPDPDEEYVMFESWSAGTTPVAASSNQRKKLEDAPAYPCMYQWVVCVAANDHSGARCRVSSYSTTYVDFSAEGSNLPAAGSASDTTYFTDSCFTSWATPVVSGALALLRSLGYDPQTQYDKLALTARSPAPPDRFVTWGEIDAGAALWR